MICFEMINVQFFSSLDKNAIQSCFIRPVSSLVLLPWASVYSSPSHRSPQFFHFCIHFCRKTPVVDIGGHPNGVGAPPPPHPTGNPGSALGFERRNYICYKYAPLGLVHVWTSNIHCYLYFLNYF